MVGTSRAAGTPPRALTSAANIDRSPDAPDHPLEPPLVVSDVTAGGGDAI